MRNTWLRNSFVYLIILVAIIALFFTVVQQGGTPDVKPIALSELAQRIKRGEIKAVEVTDDRVVAIQQNGERFSTRVMRDASVRHTPWSSDVAARACSRGSPAKVARSRHRSRNGSTSHRARIT